MWCVVWWMSLLRRRLWLWWRRLRGLLLLGMARLLRLLLLGIGWLLRLLLLGIARLLGLLLLGIARLLWLLLLRISRLLGLLLLGIAGLLLGIASLRRHSRSGNGCARLARNHARLNHDEQPHPLLATLGAGIGLRWSLDLVTAAGTTK